MLTKKTPETVKAIATVKCADSEQLVALTFYNRSTKELTEFMKNPALQTVPDGLATNTVAWMNANVCIYIIKSFDDGTDSEFPLSLEGLLEMDIYYPNVLMGFIQLFHQARMAHVEKN